MQNFFKKISLVILLFLIGTSINAFQTNSKSAIIVDANTGITLFEKNADEPIPPASMSKLMTLFMVFEALEKGQLELQERLRVSEFAMKNYGGSTMFLDTTDNPSVEELIRGVVVLSGNDASVVFAETLSPDSSEEGFAELMTQRAKELGLTNSNFKNSNGWPDPEHYMSVRDLALLSQILISRFPDYYRYFSEKEFSFDGRAPSNRFNRNPLLKDEFANADGLKTGYTKEAGYGLVGSAINDGNRVIFVFSGLESIRERTDEGLSIINWYNRQFIKKILFESNEVISKTDIWMGSSDTISVGVEEPLSVILPVNSNNPVNAKIILDEYLQAPIQSGEEIGKVVIEIPDLTTTITATLIALEDIEEANIVQRFAKTVSELTSRIF